MASRKKQEDKHLKILRELVGQQNNKKCFDCGQRGPTYVNMTVGVFVCTSCSGLLRGLNPPHRIKSISMATFSATEIEFLQNHGNEVCRGTWLALWDSSHPPEPESREEQKVKDFLIKKYERKVWYSNQPKQKVVPQSIPEAKPLKQLLGENSQEVQINKTAPPQAAPVERKTSQPVAQPPPPSKPRFDLLADLGGDPFSSSTNQHSQNQGFAAFGSQPQQQDIFGQAQHPFGDSSFSSQQPTKNPPFGGQPTPFAAQPQQTEFGNSTQSSAFGSQQQNSSNQASLINTNDPFGAVTPPASSSISFNAFAQSTSNTQSASTGNLSFFETTSQSSNMNAFGQTAAPPGLTGSELDRYKALSELDDVFRGSNTQSIFSSTPSASNAMERTTNQQPNPFMSPASGTSGIAMFQQQQQKAPNPFQSGVNTQNQGSNWGMMSGSQSQGMQAGNVQRNPQPFGQSAFGANQQSFAASQAGFPTSSQASFSQAGFGQAGYSQAGFSQAGFASSQAGFPSSQAGFVSSQAGIGTQTGFSNQMKFPTDKMPQQGQMAGLPHGQQQQQMFNSQQKVFNGQSQGFQGQQNFSGQQFMGGQQGFGGQQMHGFQNSMPGQMPGQMQGQMPGQRQGQMQGQMPGQMQGQMQGQMSSQMQGQMSGQMPGQMSGQMQGQMPGQMSNQMSGGFGNQQQQQQQFGTWGQASNKGVGAFGMYGSQTGVAQKSTNPFM